MILPNSLSWSFYIGFSYLCNCLQVCATCFSCVNRCPCRMYYVIHKLQLLLKATIHIGMHEHHVVEGMCKYVLEEIKVLVEG